MSADLRAREEMLHQLTRPDPDPRVRRRAHALLPLAQEHSVVAVTRLFATAPHRVRQWRAFAPPACIPAQPRSACQLGACLVR
jgi:hypothetical protein